MGSLMGKISVETPKYNVVASGEDYEIREYAAQVAAETTYDPETMKRGPDGGCFMVLANYIGALGKPNNTQATGETGEKIAMTAPVIKQTRPGDSEKIAMTAPVITQESSERTDEDRKVFTMQFILPSKYTSVQNTPKPTDPRVVIKEIPPKKYAVITFSGVAHDADVERQLLKLTTAVERAGFSVSGRHALAQYNPPWTPGFVRTNEVLLPVE